MMNPKHKVYYFRVSVSALVGLVSGLTNAPPLEGLSLFLLAYFLVTPLSLKLWGNELKDVGLIKLYREALGSSLLALLLVWTLVMNMIGAGVAVYVVRTSQNGVYPLQTVDGRTIGPNERPLAGYNAVSLKVSDGKIKDIHVGTYARRSEGLTRLYLGDTKVTLSNNSLNIEGEYNLSFEADLRRMSYLFKNVTLFRNGTLILNNTIRLEPGETENMKIGDAFITVTHDPKGTIHLELDSPYNGTLTFPITVFISSIVEEGDYIYVFDAFKPVWKTRTARVDDSYVIVLPPG